MNIEKNLKIYLTGFMGCGKTTHGKPLSNILNTAFFDLDYIIEHECNKPVSQIFTDEGEETFRKYEHLALRRITAQNKHFVLAAGGGTPCFADNMQFMNMHGITIYLKCNVNRLYENIMQSHCGRPLLKEKFGSDLYQYINQLLSIREPFYSQAKIILESSEHNAQTIAETILSLH